MSGQTKIGQWVQLLLLAAVHFVVDMFGNMLPVLLPVLMKTFDINLAVGGIVVASLILTCNGIQVFTGHLRSDKRQPLFLYIGLILSSAICFMALAPHSAGGVALLIAMGIISGIGIGIAHPEGLRAVHTLGLIRPATSTAAFMTPGFLGYAFGGFLAAHLVSRFGLSGLYLLLLCPVVGTLAIFLSRVHLAVDSDHETASPARDGSQEIPFGLVVAMAVPGAISTTIVTTLLPTHLVDSLNFSLAFGGFSTAMFGWGGAVGPYIWAAIAHRKGDLPCSVVAFLLSAPIVVLYLLFINSPSAAWLLFGVGFFATSAYILAITLARRCTGANLSRRMAWIVGGTWGIAYVVFMPLTWLAKCVGTGVIIRLTPIGYLVSAGLALWLMVRYPNSGLRARSSVSEAAAHDHPPV